MGNVFSLLLLESGSNVKHLSLITLNLISDLARKSDQCQSNDEKWPGKLI